MAQGGESPRLADLVAMLAAGRRLLISDEPLDDEAAAEELRRCPAADPQGLPCTLPRDHAATSAWLRRHRNDRGQEWD